MTESRMTCPKCDGEMERGFVLDKTLGAHFATHWVPGDPAKSVMWGLKLPNLLSKQPVPISTFRCASCGYLESYARKDYAAK